MELPIELQNFLMEQEVARIQNRLDMIRADPVRHKRTLQWDGRLSWRYYEGGIDGRGVRRRFCYTTTRNAAGYFLSFVEVWNTKTGRGERQRFVASKKRHLMKDRARRLWQSWRTRKTIRS